MVNISTNDNALVLKLDAWLDTMRGPEGYTGPVAHWWQNCLQFTGTGLDWRYEGIIIGYAQLYQRTADECWLNKARRAADDLVRGQLANGTFQASSFELNPYPGGTPHEAACDLALLFLAGLLRERGDEVGLIYQSAAERNLRGRYVDQLWDGTASLFRDSPRVPSFVPNKSATLAEALLLLARLNGDESLVTRYALPTLDAILAHQVRGGELDGTIYQNSFGADKVAKFMPYYVARCVPGLLAGYEWSGEERYLDGARRAMAFVMRWQYEDGSFAQIVYPGRQFNRYPQWVAAVGDMLRAADLLRPYGVVIDTAATEAWLRRGVQPSGGFATAWGFAAQTSQRAVRGVAEFRDLLPVCGWNDKVFRYLTGRMPAGSVLPEAWIADYETTCTLRGKHALWNETSEAMQLHLGTKTVYRWRKGQPWAAVAAREALWK